MQSLIKNNFLSEPENLREVRYEHSNNFAAILNSLNISLLFSTYQAGKLGVLTAKNNSLNISFHNFEQAMGMAISPTQIAVGGKDWVYFLRNAPDLAPQIEPVNSHDGCFLTRGAQYTGDIAIHDLAWGNQELWFVNTRFSCLCTLTNSYNFLPQWRPPFISAIAPEDRCHLNGLAMVNGMPKYVTVLGQTDTPGGWRDNKATDGCILEVPSGKVVTEGLSMPHSPRVYQNLLWVLNSGHGEIVAVDLATGQKGKVAFLPGFTRGLALADRFAFVGLSKIRETTIFGNLPICDRDARANSRFNDLKCGIAIVDLQTQQMLGLLEFTAGVDEIFDVQILSGIKSPVISGPHAIKDGDSAIWLLPASAR